MNLGHFRIRPTLNHGPDFKAPVPEDTLATDRIQIERKTFIFALKENKRGRFLRITEDNGRKNSIVIPVTGLDDFRVLLDRMLKADEGAPTNNKFTLD